MTERATSDVEGDEPYRWVLLGGIWFVYFCFGLVGASMAPLIAEIGSDLAIDNAAMGAILGAWQLVYIGAAIPCGILIDRLRPRTTLLLGSLVVALSAAMRGFAWDEYSMFVAVALFGVGGPLVSVGAPKLSAQWFHGRERGIAIGVYTSGPALGGAAALALSTSVFMPLFEQNWRDVMFAYAGIALAGGALWFAVAGHELARPPALGATVGGGFGLGALRDIVGRPSVQVVLAMAVGVFFVNHGMNNWLPEILRAKGLSAQSAGYWASITQIVGILGSLIVPRYAVPRVRIALLALIFTGMFAASLLLFLPPGLSLVMPLVLLGIARTSATAIIMLVLIELPGISGQRLGMLGGVFFVAGEIGGMLGPLTIGVLSQASGGFETSLGATAAVSASLIAAALGLGLIGRRTARRQAG